MAEYTIFGKQKSYLEREYFNNSKTNNEVSVVLSKGNTALFSSTRKNFIFCDVAFSIAKEQNTTFIRAPPLVLKSNPFQDERRIFLKIFYIEDDNGQFFSTDRTRRFIRLTAKAARQYLKSHGNRHFYKTTTEEDGGTEVFVEVPADKVKSTRREQRRGQYIAERNTKANVPIVSFYELESEDDCDSGEEVVYDRCEETVSEIVEGSLELEQLHQAIKELTREEFDLLQLLYCSSKPMSERKVADLIGVSHQMIHKRKKSIIKKLKKFFES